MKKECDSFVDDPSQLPAEGEVSLVIRELTPEDRRKKYMSRYVRARVSNDPDKLPDGDVLWLRWQMGKPHPKPWAIKVLEYLGDYLPLIDERR